MPGTQMGCFDVKEYIEKRDLYIKTSYVDFGIHAGCASGYPEGTLSEMWNMGATGVKFFIASAGSKWPQTFDGEVLDRFRELSSIGGLAMLHAENDQILQDNLRKLKADGRKDYAAHLEWRPPISEAECGQRMIRYLKETNCKGLIVHTSLPETVYNAMKARLEGTSVHVETCPHYLFFTDKDVKEKGPWIKFAPPARSKEKQSKMWRLLQAGHIYTLATDHAPYSKERKMEGMEDIFASPMGLPGLETLIPVMMTAVNNGQLSLQRFSALTSENPAQLYGLYPKKGSIQVGSDADMVLIDMKESFVIRAEDQITACGWTPFEGFRANGKPILSIIRGKIVMEDGQVIGVPGYGEFLPRTT
jgi:dihydroorotase (multifunctional complex type)